MAAFTATSLRYQFATVLLPAVIGLTTGCGSDPASSANQDAFEADGDATAAGEIDGDAEAACPVAVISVLDSNPQANNWLRLDGSLSYASDGPIVAFEWTSLAQNAQPVGEFSPSETAASPTLRLPAGVYEIRLSVRDSRGLSSCHSAVETVTVSP